MKNNTKTTKDCDTRASACYAEEDIRRYLDDTMSEHDIDSFELHCEACNICAAALWRQKKSDYTSNLSDHDKELYKRFLDKTRKLLKQTDTPKETFMPRGFK